MGKKYGRWHRLESTGEGGQAHVYRVEDQMREHPGYYALKRLRNPALLDRFKREVQVTGNLNHPHILRVVDFDLSGNEPYYVSEFCEKGSLEDVGAQVFKGDIRGAVDVLLPIVDALQAAASASIVHRDVKPANILIRGDATPVLADFGICHVVDGHDVQTLSDRGMGSTNYIAPEMQAGQHGIVTQAVDVYALGKVLYWMVSGGHIFAREDHRAESVYLVNRLKDERWEHVHGLLDTMLHVDVMQRASLALLQIKLPEIEDLVAGAYVPLRPSIGLRCQWCGRGRYQVLQQFERRGNIDWINSELRVLKCPHCGRLELFQPSYSKDQHWFSL